MHALSLVGGHLGHLPGHVLLRKVHEPGAPDSAHERDEPLPRVRAEHPVTAAAALQTECEARV